MTGNLLGVRSLARLSAWRSLLNAAGLIAAATFLGACGSGGGSTPFEGGGLEQSPTTGAYFFVDPHRGGDAPELFIRKAFWGRLVDVYDVDENGERHPTPVFRDFVIDENEPLDLEKARLETNPVTNRADLIIFRTLGEPARGQGDFESILLGMTRSMNPILPRNDDGTSPGPFSLVPRNSCLVLQFQDLLKDDSSARVALANGTLVKVLTDYPPRPPSGKPFEARILFDPNHGAVVDGHVHPTRILIDWTISEAESASSTSPLTPNALGLPASQESASTPNVSVRIPSRIDFGSTQFQILRNLSGASLSASGNGPVDSASPTVDVVRAMRSGNKADTNNGFLIDFDPPRLLGDWPLLVDAVHDDPGISGRGHGFLVDVSFPTLCRDQPETGDVIVCLGSGRFLQVTATGTPPDAFGAVRDLRVALLSDAPLQNPQSLLGTASFRTPMKPGFWQPGCWVRFNPPPATWPTSEVSPSNLEVVVRFSEPMDPATVQPFDTFVLVDHQVHASSTIPAFDNTVVGTIEPTSDLSSFSFVPRLALAHENGLSEEFHIELDGSSSGITDLAGKPLLDDLPDISFTLDADAPSLRTGGAVMRFETLQELPEFDQNDITGQFVHDPQRGTIRPREVRRAVHVADGTKPVPSRMVSYLRPVQTPLSPLGSRMMSVWRYCDFGWSFTDTTKYNLDIEGLHWSPLRARVNSDHYENFEIRLAHCSRLPDEWVNPNLGTPSYVRSGLLGKDFRFSTYIHNRPFSPSPEVIVHDRRFGYRIDPINLWFAEGSSLPLLPYPLNKSGDPGAPHSTYTWRDTSILSVAGDGGAGVPLEMEVRPPLRLYPGQQAGSFYAESLVPTIGLPLLMEYRCYPTSQGLGNNGLFVSVATLTSPRPSFRVFSTGGYDTSSQPVIKHPDYEEYPTGGFNPSSTPPGLPTVRASDNTFYNGAIETVVRVSRVHTVWIDIDGTHRDLHEPVIQPGPDLQPAGTQLIVQYRGASSYRGDPDELHRLKSASFLDAYGDVKRGGPIRPVFLNGLNRWFDDIDEVDGSRLLQMRFTFLNNIDPGVGLTAELSAVGIPYAL